MIAIQEFTRNGLNFEDRYVFIRELEDAAQAVGIARPTLSSNHQADGTWNVTGSLEGEAGIVDELASREFLGLPLVSN